MIRFWILGIASSRAESTNAWPHRSWLGAQGWNRRTVVRALRPKCTRNNGIPSRLPSQRRGSFAAWTTGEKARYCERVSWRVPVPSLNLHRVNACILDRAT